LSKCSLYSLILSPVVWSVTPLFAEWIASDNSLAKNGFLNAGSVVLELGSGVSGIVALSLAPHVKQYIATDQDYVLKLLKQNLDENTKESTTHSKHKHSSKRAHSARSVEKKKKATSNIETLVLDWEKDSVATLPSFLGQTRSDLDDPIGVDVLLACDCIYNDALIEPFINTCTHICRLRSRGKMERPTVCVVAQQLRSAEVFESWLTTFHQSFNVWRLPDELLSEPLKENSGDLRASTVVSSTTVSCDRDSKSISEVTRTRDSGIELRRSSVASVSTPPVVLVASSRENEFGRENARRSSGDGGKSEA